MAHRDQAPRSNVGFSPHRPWGLPTTTSAGQQGPAAGASHLEFTQGRLRKKRLQAPLTKWTAGLTRSPSRVDLRGCHGSPQILTASRRQKLIHRISFGPAEARGLFGCRTGSGRLAQNMEIPFAPRLFIGAGSVLQRRHCAPRRPSAPRTGTTTSGEAKDVLYWHSRRAFKIFVSA